MLCELVLREGHEKSENILGFESIKILTPASVFRTETKRSETTYFCWHLCDCDGKLLYIAENDIQESLDHYQLRLP